MKKLMLLLIVPVLVLGIVGCTSNIGDATVVDIIENTLEASNSITSQHMSITMDQVFNVGGEESEATTTVIEADIINDPVSFYMNTINEDYGINMEMYVTPEGNYLKDIESDGWFIINDEIANVSVTDTQTKSATEIIETFKDFPADFTLEDKDGNYTLSIDASDEKFAEVLEDQLAASMPEDFEAEQLMNSIKINTMKYSITIDKETYLPKDMNMEMDFDIALLGMTLNLNQKANATFSKYNEVEDIVVPDEVIQNAVPIE